MPKNKKDNRTFIYVYADWKELGDTKYMGALTVDVLHGREIFSFDYDKDWITKNKYFQLDPDLQLYKGPQYLSDEKINFGAFLDSCPDRWGRVLMGRREAILAKEEKRTERKLYEKDYLLGVFDGNRMGAFRFKLDPDGNFLNNNKDLATPPWARLRELEQASLKIEEDGIENTKEYLKWINMLISPGSSLGGARPKASIVDESNELWIAKFPSRKDDVDIGGWEMVACRIALEAGINMAECRVNKFNSPYHTFMTKRFDGEGIDNRIHFSSAMTCLGKVDGNDGSDGVSYLNIAEFLVAHGSNTNSDRNYSA